MRALAVIGFWIGVLGVVFAVGHWGPAAWRRTLASAAGPWVFGAICAVVLLGVLGSLWAAGQMSTGTPYP